MSLTPTQLQELQTIVETLRTEFPNSDDDLWQAAIRIQKGGLGPVTGTGGQPAFDAAVADIVEEAEQVSTVQGRQGGLGESFDVAVFNVVPIEGELPAGSVGDVIYLDTAPNTYLATDVIELTPAGPNSVIISEVGTQVARSVPAASGGMEVNNLATGAGFERVLTLSDMGGSGITVEDEGTPLPGTATTLDFVGAGVTASGAGATKTITIPGGAPGGADGNVQYNSAGSFAGSADLDWDAGNRTLSISNVFSAAPALQLNLGNNPSTAIIIDSLLSTNYVAMRMNDQTGSNFFLWRHDYQLSTPNHELTLESSAFGDIMEIENEGNVYIGGTESSALLKVFAGSSPNRVKIDGSASQRSLYFEEKPSASADVASEGQLWVRNDTPNVLVFTDDTGQDFVLNEGANVVAGTIDTQGLAWDVGNGQYEPTPEFSIYQAGNENFAALGKGLNGSKFQFLGSITTPGDERGFVGFEASTLRMFVANQTSNSDVAIQARDGGAVDRVLGIFNPTSDTAIFGQVTGVRISSRTSSPVRFLVNNADRVTVDDQGLNVIGNGVQAGVIDLTEGPSAFSSVAGQGQLWARNDTPNTLIYQDDAGNLVPLSISFTATEPGNVPASGGGTTNFLRADGTFAAPPGGTPGGANTAVQFNNGGAFGGSSDFEWDGSQLKIEASQAQLFLDETDGGGAAQLFLTSTTTADSALVIEFDSSTGVDARIRQATSGGTLQDTWITFREDQGVGLRFNDVPKFSTLATGVLSNDSIYIAEKAASNADTAGQGQLWVRNDAFVPALMYTDDTGSEYQVSGNFLSQRLAGSVLLSGTGFVGVLNAGPKGTQYYQYVAAFEVTAPAADDIKIQLVFDTAAYFMGTVTWAGSGITNGSEQLEGQTGDVVTNTVVIPTSGVVAQGGGTFVTIVGTYFHNGGGPTTFSLRCAKNADTGADGFIRFASAHFLMPWGDQTNP